MNRATTEDRPPFRIGRFWLPPVLLTAACGLVLLMFVDQLNAFGYATMLGGPFVLGLALGYGLRVGKVLAYFVPILVVVGLLCGALSAQWAGFFCVVLALVIFLGPLVVGTTLGIALRAALKTTRFSQRWYLPILILFTLDGGLIFLEHRLFKEEAIAVVRTERIVAFPADELWSSLVFYEEVRHAPPWLARIGLPHPRYTTGRIRGTGDVKACVYTKGHLTKRITDYSPGELLGFRVVEQNGIEDRSVRLVSGSFRFEPLGSHRTRITLTTEYVPLLSARWVWAPFERAVTGALHEHVLDGIELEAARRQRMLMARSRP